MRFAPFFINEWHDRGLRSHAFKTCFFFFEWMNVCVCEGSRLLPQSSFILFSWLHCLVVCLMSGLSFTPDKPTQDANSTVTHCTCVGSFLTETEQWSKQIREVERKRRWERKRRRLPPDMPVSLCKLIFGAMSVQLSHSLSVTPSRELHNTVNYHSQRRKDGKIKKEWRAYNLACSLIRVPIIDLSRCHM